MLLQKHHRGALNVECRQYSPPAEVKIRFSSHNRNREGAELVVLCYLSFNKERRRYNVLLPERCGHDSEQNLSGAKRGRAPVEGVGDETTEALALLRAPSA